MPEPETQLTVHAAAGEPALVRAEAAAGNGADDDAEAEVRDTRLDRLSKRS